MASHRRKRSHRRKNVSPVLITGIVFVVIALYLSYRIYTFYLLPKLWRLILMAVLLVIAGIFLALSIIRRDKGQVLKVVEIILCVLMAIASVTLPYIEKRIENLFSTHIRTDIQDYRVYTFTAEYRTEHPELPFSRTVSKNLLDYSGSVFLYPQSASEAQVQALDKLKIYMEFTPMQKTTLWETMQAFYGGEGECILLSDMAVDMLEDTDEYANFSNDTLVLMTIQTEVDIEEDLSSKISDGAFTVFVAGNDTRSGKLSIYGRTDVDILLTVNPETAQALIISIPRDTFLPNPALNYDYDKLTHLGNDGIMNTVQGLNDLYDLDVKHYATVNFVTFQRIIDTLGGIDIENPYDFQGIQRYFPAGSIHLNGVDALDYVRERHTLDKGDFDRNEHQAIVLRAILQKLLSREVLEKAPELLNNLTGSVATNIEPSSILELASEELVAKRDWNIIYYHLGGYGTRAETASMPGMSLYVVRPYKSQTDFAHQEIMNALTGQILEQKQMPAADKTVYEEN